MVEFADSFRLATVVLVDGSGNILGRLPPVKLDQPWFQEISQLVYRVKQTYDLDIVILRLLTTNTDHLPEIEVDYLAETAGDTQGVPLRPWTGEIGNDPLRLPYAKPGGPAEDLAWAGERLAERGFGEITSKRQLRTWNLSSIWRLDTTDGRAWLKSIPPFFSHEGAIIDLLVDEKVPALIASDDQRVLMEDLSGEDCYDATLDQKRHMIGVLVDLQFKYCNRTDELMKAGLPDLRSSVLLEQIQEAIDREIDNLEEGEQAALTSFVQDLPGRFAQLAECGIPDTLVHGDYHPGNWRGTGMELTMLDWGDCSVGHPLLDMPPLLERAGEHQTELETHWIDCWQKHLPNSDAENAARLIAPIASARLAALYHHFLDNIEQTERVYHDTDSVFCLKATVRGLDREKMDEK
jgi:hypothetical protein